MADATQAHFSAAFIEEHVFESAQFRDAFHNHAGTWSWVRLQYARQPDGSWRLKWQWPPAPARYL